VGEFWEKEALFDWMILGEGGNNPERRIWADSDIWLSSNACESTKPMEIKPLDRVSLRVSGILFVCARTSDSFRALGE
jgi:hypothetical protein